MFQQASSLFVPAHGRGRAERGKREAYERGQDLEAFARDRLLWHVHLDTGHRFLHQQGHQLLQLSAFDQELAVDFI